ncbi:MAG: hypothetical protein ACR2MP_22630 [Streptosporangiaceae bacterium]
MNAAADAYRTQAQATTGKTPSDAATLDALHSQVQGNASQIGRSLRDAGAITSDEHRDLQAAIKEAVSFKPDSASDAGPLPGVAAVGDLDIPDAIKGPLIAAIADLATLSAARRSDTTGPFAKLGHATATVGAAGGLLAAGQPVAAVGALLGAREVSKYGGMAGGLVDRFAGTAAPPVFLRRGPAQSVLQRAGVDPGQDSVTATKTALATLSDPQARLNLSLGLPLDTPAAPPAAAAMTPMQQARGLNLSEQAGRSVEQAAIQSAIARGQAASATSGGQPQDPATSAPPVAPWQPGQPPIGLKVIQDAALRSQAAKLQATAVQNTPEAVGQRLMDQAAARAASTLAAEHQAPQGTSAGDPTAVAAAIAQASQRAAAVRRLAAGGQDEADRVSVGNPMRDPVPVNTPLGADGTPQSGNPSVVQAAIARQAAQAPTDAAQAPPGVPGQQTQGSGQMALGTLPQGWQSYVLNGLLRAGIVAKPGDIHGALDDLTAAGELSPAHAAAMKAHGGPIMVPELLNRVAAQTAQRTGNADRLNAGLSTGAPSDAAANAATTNRGTIKDPLRWMAAREDSKQAAEGLANQAERMGDHDLAVTVRQVAAEPSAVGKAKLAADYIASIRGSSSTATLRKARAIQILSGPLLKGST